jgi:hypothetical protein
MKVKGFIISESRPFGIQTSTPPPHLGTGRSHVIATAELFSSTHKRQQQPEQIPLKKEEMKEGEEEHTHASSPLSRKRERVKSINGVSG